MASERNTSAVERRTAVISSHLSREPCAARGGPLPLSKNGGLVEFSVIYTDRALNSMSSTFIQCMKDLNESMTKTYNAKRLVILPGSGSYAMEAVARQFASGKKVLVLRNGYFSYRWTDIFEQTGIASSVVVVKAQPIEGGNTPHYAPLPLAQVQDLIRHERPAVIFAPHVETSTGIVLPDAYVQGLSKAAREVGALLVLDGIAAGMQWIDLAANGVDAYITAPQKGWTGPACVGMVLLGERGYEACSNTTSNSMVLNLKKWRDLMETYLGGNFAYYTTLPTDALITFRDVALETEAFGLAKAKAGQIRLGAEVRAMLEKKGFKSVASDGFKAPGVVVSYTSDTDMFNKFKKQGMQVALGVPFQLDEKNNQTFRIGLFGIDKIYDIPKTVARLESAVDKILAAK